jgi:hypothetical protein
MPDVTPTAPEIIVKGGFVLEKMNVYKVEL